MDRSLNERRVIDALSLFCCSWAELQARSPRVRMRAGVFARALRGAARCIYHRFAARDNSVIVTVGAARAKGPDG